MADSNSVDLSDDELTYYSRQFVLDEIGYAGQIGLKGSSATIVGLGGLGTPAATQLASMGVGNLRLIDRDVVSVSNLHRQHLYTSDDIGHPKVEVAAKRLQALNPHIDIEPIPWSIQEGSVDELVSDVDVVVDGLDNLSARFLVNRACQKHGVPYVFAGAIRTYGTVSTLVPGKTPCLECFYSNVPEEDLPKCAVVGVHPSLLGVIASIEASEAIRILLGKEPNLACKLAYFDIFDLSLDSVAISKSPSCSVCGETPSGKPELVEHKEIEEICGRGGRRTFVVQPSMRQNLNLDDLVAHAKEEGFEILVDANLGVTFKIHLEGVVSILKSGIMIYIGGENEKQVRSFYDDFIGLGLD
ncbi:MAG: HesA/MoeB/ThiF family protein [Candidatus Thorarchaeota archaeon]